MTRAMALLLVLATAAGAAPLGPAARDAEGLFLNRAGELAHAGPLITWPFFLRRIGTTLWGRSGRPDAVANDGRFLRENAGHSVPTVTWVGHATLVVQMADLTMLTDPIWSDRASPLGWAGPRRYRPPGIALAALPPIDAVLVSHNHYDHLDVTTLAEVALLNPRARFLVPLGNGALLRDAGVANVEELDWGQHVTVGAATIHCLPSQHWSQRGLADRREALWGSWAVVGPDRRFYFAGDTGYADHLAAIGTALGPFDLAALPIGAYSPRAMMRPWHLDPEEAVRGGADLRARRLLGIHFGTFDLADEPLDEPPRRFQAAGPAGGFAADALWVLPIGGTRAF